MKGRKIKTTPTFTQGICKDGATILCNGQPMTPEEILYALRALSALYELKLYKDEFGKDNYYLENKQEAWNDAEKSLMMDE